MSAAASIWTARVLTIFPEMFPGMLGLSLAGKALERGLWSLQTVDIRDFADDRHGTVDDAPFGGGAGMVMRADVTDRALGHAVAADEAVGGGSPVIYLSPRGRALNQARCRELADGPGVILLCGRYEGVDQRVLDAREVEEISLGDYVLSGGEPAALALIDACVRLLPGVMGKEGSLEEESFESGLLEYSVPPNLARSSPHPPFQERRGVGDTAKQTLSSTSLGTPLIRIGRSILACSMLLRHISLLSGASPFAAFNWRPKENTG